MWLKNPHAYASSFGMKKEIVIWTCVTTVFFGLAAVAGRLVAALG